MENGLGDIMKKKHKKLLKKAGFCFWDDESWKPEGAVIDWANNYDKEIVKYTKLLTKQIKGELKS
jgi:hypothetical protein